jgi:hypothetical protein
MKTIDLKMTEVAEEEVTLEREVGKSRTVILNVLLLLKDELQRILRINNNIKNLCLCVPEIMSKKFIN